MYLATKQDIMGEKALATYNIKEYLSFEKEAETRHEFHNGEIFAMAGGTPNHSILGGNIVTELNLRGRSKGCTIFNGDARIRIETSNRFLYPEASVVCGEVEFSKDDPNAITNPMLIAEVLSESSEAYDRGAKFMYYQQIPSFREYILISQLYPVVNTFYKKDNAIWEMQTIIGLDGEFEIRTLGGIVKMADLYRNTRGLTDPL
ncbi:MAG: Uma2 family endonuclease [Bacteroidia bacterium]|nr:Uma2 family endonuclease [Bacteroidia bacterium]